MAFRILVVLSYPVSAWLLLEAGSLEIDQAVGTFDTGFSCSDELSAIDCLYFIARAYICLLAP